MTAYIFPFVPTWQFIDCYSIQVRSLYTYCDVMRLIITQHCREKQHYTGWRNATSQKCPCFSLAFQQKKSHFRFNVACKIDNVSLISLQDVIVKKTSLYLKRWRHWTTWICADGLGRWTAKCYIAAVTWWLELAQRHYGGGRQNTTSHCNLTIETYDLRIKDALEQKYL